jgi:hypothetical protein
MPPTGAYISIDPIVDSELALFLNDLIPSYVCLAIQGVRCTSMD